MWAEALIVIASFLIVLKVVYLMRDKFLAQKLLHLYVSVATLLLYYSLPEEYFIALTSLFVIINIRVLPSYMFSRKSGVVLYPLAVLIAAIFFYDNERVFTLSLYPMFFSDPLGALVGRYFGKLKFLCNKTIEGTLAVFSMNIFLFLSGGFSFFEATIISVVLALVELISFKGLDNLSVPIFAMAILGGWGSLPLWIALPVSLIVGLFIVLVKWLDSCGAMAAAVLGLVVLYSGGFKWVIPLITFVATASVIGRIIGDKEKTRKANQVFANGGVSAIMAVLYSIFHQDIFFYMHLSAVASMLADTLATEMGMRFSKGSYLITNFTPVKKGTSGGVSIPGFLGALLGSIIIALFAGYQHFISVVISGFLGSLVDSYLGAVFERRGLWNNDITNFLASLSGALIYFIIHGGALSFHSIGL